MSYKVIAGCTGGNCPKVHSDDDQPGDYVLVQGEKVDPAVALQLGIPEGETLVRVPRSLLVEVADA